MTRQWVKWLGWKAVVALEVVWSASAAEGRAEAPRAVAGTLTRQQNAIEESRAVGVQIRVLVFGDDHHQRRVEMRRRLDAAAVLL